MEFGRDCFMSGTPDRLDPAEEYLAGVLSPDECREEGLALGGVMRITLVDPAEPERGFRLKTPEELNQ